VFKIAIEQVIIPVKLEKSFKTEILQISNESEFSAFALQLFKYQAEYNPVYKNFLAHLGRNPAEIHLLKEIPFIPVSFFKNHIIRTGEWAEQLIFESSGTTGSETSRHYIQDPGFYLEVCKTAFTRFYGSPEEFVIIALLPSYLERSNSSLVYMMQEFIRLAKTGSGFYLNNIEELILQIKLVQQTGRKLLLLGVSFALLDLAETVQLDLNDAIIMETGGMKGRREELTREELHTKLKSGFNVTQVHSEYGMTELLSQGYSTGDGMFYAPPWMRVMIRDVNDPFEKGWVTKRGGINVIDLANIDSCAFIETQDLGVVFNDGGFQVLGRFDNSDLRGCNLLLHSV
jgi:phenylacetate-coenzyme A ligase PaaK-like adenylate-forming protein